MNIMKNMRLFLFVYACLVIIVNIVSCKKVDYNSEILTTAEQMVEQYPDSALYLLDSIPNPYLLNNKEQNKYWLLQIQAKDKSHKDIASDTVIFSVRDYYKKEDDVENMALSSFYCGRVLQEQSRWDAAMTEYLKADEYAEKTKNKNLRGLSQSLMGEVLIKELMPEEAIKHFQIAVQHFRKAYNVKNEIISYNFIGNTYLKNSINDSAFYYYNKGLELAKANNDSLQMTIFIQNIGVAYREIGKYDLADKYFRDAAEHTTNSNDKIKLYLNLSKTFYGRGMLDSAKVYVDKSLSLSPDNGDIFVVTDMYKTISKIAEKHSDYQQSLKYYKEYTNNLRKIIDDNYRIELLKLQKKYNYERFQNENSKLKIIRQKAYISFSIVFLIICLIALFYYKKSADNIKTALEKENQIMEAEKKIYQLMEISSNYNSKINSLRNLSLQHFDILKKVSLLKISLKKKEYRSHPLIQIFNEIVYGQETMNWDLLYQDINNINNGLFNRLKDRYPELTETEFRICYLTYSDFSCSEIGIIINLSSNTVQQKRSIIRKKLGIESEGNIKSYLDKTLSKQ